MKIYVLCVGKIVDAGPVDWGISPLPAPEPEPVDGDLQRTIDEGEQTREYEEDIEDRTFWARGQW
jgi:hypothetical protein